MLARMPQGYHASIAATATAMLDQVLPQPGPARDEARTGLQ